MRLRKLIAGCLTLSLMSVALVGCGSKNNTSDDTLSNETTEKTETAEAEKVSLTVWGPQEDQAAIGDYKDGILKAMCDKFNEAHPEWDITFEYGVCSEGDAKDVVTKDVAAAADVYMFANDQIPILEQSGALAELGGKTVENIEANNEESIINSVKYKDGYYGVPFTSNTWFMYYDKSKFDENEVKSLDTMMAKDLGDGVTNFAFPLDNSWYISSFYYAAGGTLFGDGTDASKGCTFDDDNCKAMTSYLVDLAANPKFSCEKEGSSIGKFKEGTLGAYCSGSWDADPIKKALGDNFACTNIPTVTVNGKEGQMKSFVGSKAIGVNPNCKNPQVAVALADYLGGQECQQIRFDTRQIIPTNTTVAQSAAVLSNEVAQAQTAEISNASMVQPLLQEMNSYWTPAETMGKEIVQGDVTKENAAEKTELMTKGILQSN
ncbi:extracellular solute-binding protein [[Clostridium] polysaccharolyticum]|uniref:Carbohydrate ABC transporter substrate-binding protein, CUT1 family (TC 3.A.1.1.-) n=1 Tax=[Clostridium] polysaccharolyticum TaxID=29364 RepID=A0A1I0FVV6_9FIRM|nr:extracellular solute-binding protein [[Clostridium] polysaccharolyticum]SET62472.1 carbohydrate ABC transporter substrate-binding protein, CUT1 family (TC 3.A.1.1.-) [[Clostridium] polysaccharolyticum]